jgi:hypothetical protein
MSAQHIGSVDILTRSTLQVDGSLSVPSVTQMVSALHHVPGVLLAEFDRANGRATVAHDSAVSTDALLAAATGAGVRATIVTDRRVPAASANTIPPSASMPLKRLLPLAAALILFQVVLASVSPSLAKNHVLLPMVLAFGLGFAFFSVSLARRT